MNGPGRVWNACAGKTIVKTRYVSLETNTRSVVRLCILPSATERPENALFIKINILLGSADQRVLVPDTLVSDVYLKSRGKTKLWRKKRYPLTSEHPWEQATGLGVYSVCLILVWLVGVPWNQSEKR